MVNVLRLLTTVLNRDYSPADRLAYQAGTERVRPPLSRYLLHGQGSKKLATADGRSTLQPTNIIHKAFKRALLYIWAAGRASEARDTPMSKHVLQTLAHGVIFRNIRRL